MRFVRPARLSMAVAFTALAVFGGAAQAGTVTVSYPRDARLSDAGDTAWDRAATQRDLTQYLQSLGKQYLPADRELKLEVLDIDLAGEMRPARHTLRDVRVARGGADWPRITVRYMLQSNGQVLKSGEEEIVDMDYLHRINDRYNGQSLKSEKQMLEQWFKTRFVTAND